MLPLDVNKKNSIIAALLTLVFCLLLLGCCFWLGLYRQNPPPPEEGVEVNVGTSDFGQGDNRNPVPEAPNNPSRVNTSDNTLSENVSTQSTDETVALNNNPDTENKEKTPEEVKEKEPTINQNALFPGKRNKINKDNNQGVSTGTGDQGVENGNTNSNVYDGVPGTGGTNYSLAGRKASSLPKPTYNSNKQGKVVVKIWVDKEGNVVKAEPGQRGSTTTNADLLKRAKDAAMKAKFSPNKNAQDLQVGTITYDFRNYN